MKPSDCEPGLFVLCSSYDFDFNGCPLGDACFPAETGCPDPTYDENGCMIALSVSYNSSTHMACPGFIGLDVRFSYPSLHI